MKDPFIPEAELDFHQIVLQDVYSIEVAIDDFLEESYHSGLDTVLIITGKGLNSLHGPRIKPITLAYLADHKRVKEFGYAPAQFGGEGAIAIFIAD